MLGAVHTPLLLSVHGIRHNTVKKKKVTGGYRDGAAEENRADVVLFSCRLMSDLYSFYKEQPHHYIRKLLTVKFRNIYSSPKARASHLIFLS